MRNHSIRLCLALLLCIPINSHAQSLALSFDDGLDPRVQSQAPYWNAAILAALSQTQIKSILFAAGMKVDSPEGLKLVEEWGNAGPRRWQSYLLPS